MFEYAERLTKVPAAVTLADIEKLHDAGLSDREVLDLADVVAYFNYVNRLAEGLGVKLE